jgi:hypothetical protein
MIQCSNASFLSNVFLLKIAAALRKIVVLFILASVFVEPVFALTQKQKMGLLRHGIWEWSIRTCPNILRNKGYWFALKEVGEFKNADQIIQNENDQSFLDGWNYMASNAQKFGQDKTCAYAIEQWPAVLWSESVQPD